MGQGTGTTAGLEYPTLISERRFCTAYGSLWQALTPMCDHFVRRVNQGLRERVWSPLASGVLANRRGLINEIAFQIFAHETRAHLEGTTESSDLNDIVQLVSKRLAKFDQSHSDLTAVISDDERTDIAEQLRRLRQRFPILITGRIVVEPQFAGCGFLDSCKGDVLYHSVLCEVKAGERPIRSIDLRQLITYAALNYVAKSYQIDAVSVVNVRSGLVFELGLEDLVKQISGLHPSELFESITYSLSSGDMSR